MKKSIITTGIMSLMLLSTTAVFADTNKEQTTIPNKKPCPCAKQLPQKGERPNLGDRLKLTEEQKQKAHEIRMDGHKQMKPVFEKMQLIKQELKTVEASNISQEEKDIKIKELKNQLRALHQEAKKIRIENTKQFESILTPEQKTEFEKIKQEGREKMKQYKKMKKAPLQNK